VNDDVVYYVTVQDQNGEAVGGRLRLETSRVLDFGALRSESGHLMLELIKELWSRG
jgi:hypothetical protein